MKQNKKAFQCDVTLRFIDSLYKFFGVFSQFLKVNCMQLCQYHLIQASKTGALSQGSIVSHAEAFRDADL